MGQTKKDFRMLTCQGLIVLPQNLQLKEYSNEKGVTFFFNFATFDDRTENFHQFQGSLWVPGDKVDSWRKKLTPNRTFLLKYGEVSAPFKEKDKMPFVNIRITHTNLVPLKKIFFDKEEK